MALPLAELIEADYAELIERTNCRVGWLGRIRVGQSSQNMADCDIAAEKVGCVSVADGNIEAREGEMCSDP